MNQAYKNDSFPLFVPHLKQCCCLVTNKHITTPYLPPTNRLLTFWPGWHASTVIEATPPPAAPSLSKESSQFRSRSLRFVLKNPYVWRDFFFTIEKKNHSSIMTWFEEKYNLNLVQSVRSKDPTNGQTRFF